MSFRSSVVCRELERLVSCVLCVEAQRVSVYLSLYVFRGPGGASHGMATLTSFCAFARLPARACGLCCERERWVQCVGASHWAYGASRHYRYGLHILHCYQRQVYGQRAPQNPLGKWPRNSSRVHGGLLPSLAHSARSPSNSLSLTAPFSIAP